MSRLRILVAVLALAATARAQAYLLDDPATWRLFTRLDVLASEIGSEGTLLAGLGAGVQLRHDLLAGLHAALALEGVETPQGHIEGGDFWQLGGRVDWVFHRTDLLNAGAHLILAAQHVDARLEGVGANDSSLLLQPGVDLSLNLWPGAELGATAGFRFLDGVAAGGYDDDDLSGFVGGLFLRFVQRTARVLR